MTANADSTRRNRPPKPQTISPCYVYLMEQASGLMKIGISNNPQTRVKQIISASGFHTNLIHDYECPTRCIAEDIERQLHAVFSEKRMNGEWFEGLSKQEYIDALDDRSDYVLSSLDSDHPGSARYFDHGYCKCGCKINRDRVCPDCFDVMNSETPSRDDDLINELRLEVMSLQKTIARMVQLGSGITDTRSAGLNSTDIVFLSGILDDYRRSGIQDSDEYIPLKENSRAQDRKLLKLAYVRAVDIAEWGDGRWAYRPNMDSYSFIDQHQLKNGRGQ